MMMTHLHFDHVTGLSKWAEGKLVPAFENAVVWVNQIEWDEMREPNIRSKNTYWEQNWKPVVKQIHTYQDNKEILNGITMHHTGGA